MFFEGGEGDADDDDGNGREEVQTEMVALDLRGNSSLGPVRVTLDDRAVSTGLIEERTNNTSGHVRSATVCGSGSGGQPL